MERSIEPEGRGRDEKSGSRRSDGQGRTIAAREDFARARATIDRIVRERPTMSEFLDRLGEAGIRAVPSLQKSRRLNGMSYEVDGQRIKGSDLGRAYTAQGLRKSGVQYEARRDFERLAQAVARGSKDLVRWERPRPGSRDRANRARKYDGLSAAQRAALREIGRFRTVASEDFARIQYRGDRGAWRQDFARLSAQKLVEQRSVVVATHSKTTGRKVKPLSVVVLTKQGKQLLRRSDPATKSAGQALYAGFVKPREIAHDVAIYRMFQAEEASIQKEGGRVKRIVLDFELKKRVYSPLAKSRDLPAVAYARKQAQVAEENGLRVVEGKIRFPDLRIEYETATGEATRVDLELATEHYRGDHMASKDKAGFKIYAENASYPRFGGSNGRSRPSDEDHLIEIFSF